MFKPLQLSATPLQLFNSSFKSLIFLLIRQRIYLCCDLVNSLYLNKYSFSVFENNRTNEKGEWRRVLAIYVKYCYLASQNIAICPRCGMVSHYDDWEYKQEEEQVQT
jgi:hypothetical protein